ncbi:MAG: HEPN domain-containing protein [Anaerolineae bacterium]
MNVQARRWLEQAWHDLDAALQTADIDLPDVALILCQQAVEKGLKALYIAQTNQLPPRVHSIERLADMTAMRSQLESALLELEDYYTRLRYPDFAGPLPFELAKAQDADQAIELAQDALVAIRREIDALADELTDDAEQEDG